MSNKKSKCYTCRDSEGDVEMVWHSHDLAAKRLLAEIVGCEFQEVNKFQRAPEFDKYAELGKVPDDILLFYGWYLPCREGDNYCQNTVNEDDYIRYGKKVICSDCFDKQTNNKGA